MRNILFQGKSVEDNTWMVGYYCAEGYGDCESPCILPQANDEHIFWGVYPESVGQYTGMNEFVMADKSVNAPLFEGDIVEVWSRRRSISKYMHDKPQSQYDIQVKARATIVFCCGTWMLDYNNNYNNSLCKLKGKEEDERTVNAYRELYDYGYCGNNEDWHREHNSHCKWDDIVKIGNKFDNPELLDG